MPAPFPGMHPYLEGYLWLGFHGDLCTEIKRQLAPKLAPRYYPYSTRYYLLDDSGDIEVTADQVIPDVGVTVHGRPAPSSSGSVIAAPAQMHLVMPVPVPHYRIEIRDVNNRELVTAIEFLSPTNKREPGRKKYLSKRRKLLSTMAHLIEVDLLRKGQRLPMKEPYPPAEYYILLSRAQKRPLTDVWPISLFQLLPTIPVPLLDDDPDVPLDLQSAMNNVYDLGLYASSIDYAESPGIRLTDDQNVEADRLLRAAGLRS